MAVPRNRSSNARKNKRRSHFAKKPMQFVKCSHCGVRKLPHVLCMACGHYGAKQLLSQEAE